MSLEPQTRGEFVHNADLAPTLAEIAGLRLPSEVDGRSMVPLLRGESPDWRDAFYYEVPSHVVGVWPSRALRTRDWKYIQTFDPETASHVVFEELYDLRSDPFEKSNLLADATRSVDVEEMLHALRERLDEEHVAIWLEP